MHPFYLRILVFLIFVTCAVVGIKLSQVGFSDIESFKRLERLVPTKILGALEGENQVSGWVSKTSAQNYLKSPKTSTPSVYYRYLLEREEEDSDGDKYWVTVQDESLSVDFFIEDSTGKASVITNESTDEIRWLLPKRFSKRVGGFRYSEWRIEPDDKVSMFAWAEVKAELKTELKTKQSYPSAMLQAMSKALPQKTSKELSSDTSPDIHFRFDKEGLYIPIITSLSAGKVRADIGNSAIIKIWLGVSLISLGLMCFVYATQIHRILVFLSLLTLFTMGVLGAYGMASLSSDVRGGSGYFYAQQDKAELAITNLLASETNQNYHQNNASLPKWKQVRVNEIRQNLGVLQALYQQQIGYFPENIFAWFVGIDKPSLRIELSEDEKSFVQQKIGKFEKTQVDGFAYWWVLAGSLVFLALSYLGFRFAKVKRMIENVPTSATAGVSFGLAEVKGNVKLIEDQSLTGPLTSLSCVWYRYLIQKRKGSGKNARWVTISDDTQHKRFYCEDNEGSLTIDPDDAEIVTRHKKVSRKGKMRYSEWLIKPRDKLYALGMAKIDPQKSDQLLLGKPQHNTDNSDLFILTNYSEKELMIKKASIAMLALALAFSGMFCSAVFTFGMNGQFAATDYLFSALLAPLFLIFFMFVLHYNDLIFLQNRADRNWANIQVSLKKRADLLPQLVKVLSGYKAYENELLEQITLQRKQLNQSLESIESASNFIRQEHEIMQGMRVAVEAYPDLKANDISRKLMTSLSDLENEIALMRTGYNDAVNLYNTRVESFPDLLLAKAFKFVKKEWI